MSPKMSNEEIIITAKTVDEALSKAEAEYGSQGDISYEILEMPKKGFFGIGSAPAKIKVTINREQESILSEINSDRKNAPKPKNTQPRRDGADRAKNQPKPQETKKNAPARDAKDAQSKSQDKPQNKQKDQSKQDGGIAAQDRNGAQDKQKAPKNQNRDSGTKKAPKEPDTQKQTASENTEKKPQKGTFVEKERPNIVITEKEMELALGFINTLLRNMESEAHAEAAVAPEGAVFEGVYPKIEIVGDRSGILIGHHGETLDAIQFLANLCVNRKTGTSGKDFVKITVDIENYREKREATLRALARRMAQKAIKYKRNMVLEPMNPYERRIIHSELQTFENVDTHSVGSDENRKVVITYEGADKAEQKRSQKNRRNSSSKQGGAQKESAKSAPVRRISEEESAKIQETYAAYQEEKAGRERPRRASSIDEILGTYDGPDEPAGL